VARRLDDLMSRIPRSEGVDLIKRFRCRQASLLKKIREREFCDRLIWLWLRCQLRPLAECEGIADQIFAEWIGFCD
jgi:hypothetical protein